MRLSERVSRLSPSLTLQLVARTKELRVQGAYAYGWEDWPDTIPTEDRLRISGGGLGKNKRPDKVKTMALALEFLRNGKAGPLEELVNRTYRLSQYRRALDDAFNAGRSGAFKVVFELQ